ncbi:MAG: 2-amino-4-hydroxy-6-hydroxymethyldihydropteridine diphosphokinase [Bacteroidetes bacterium]|nr:2-amino-4-hydroxy-6-hydroxymethyldihydropteridine diphosphokinase [Bacteroidota bacterium]MCA6443242.1 2-amino-4-hydroxy-6-hydroxymethyldihydropteridine diphosphokinase [Bacteroidota bacterium]
MYRAFLCLGTNLANRQFNLIECANLIEKKLGFIVQKSSIYESPSWGYQSSNRFLNQVLEIKTKLNPQKLLKVLLQLESSMGRKRKEGNAIYADRLIDIDILFIDELKISTQLLNVPHPLLHQRNFVLQPLNEIAPNFVHPVLNKTIKELISKSKDKTKLNILKPIKYICIEGNIGAGKSTLALALTEKLHAGYLPEQFEEDDLLALFYKNPKKYSFLLEMGFLIGRYKQLLAAKDASKIVVSDFSFYKCLWFAKVNLSTKEFKIFKTYYSKLKDLLPKPDCIVYIQTSISNLTKNINKRARPYEKEISTSYLRSIENAYSTNLNNNLKGVDVIKLKWIEYNKEELDEAVESIVKKLMN